MGRRAGADRTGRWYITPDSWGDMEQIHDIFEVLPDGSLEWRECVDGRDPALSRAKELAASSANEFRVMHLPTGAIVAVLNAKQPSPDSGDACRNANEAATHQGGLPAPWWSFVRRSTKSVL